MSQDRLRRAVFAHLSGQNDEAERLYREIVADEPDNAKALQYLGVLLASTKREDEGYPLLERAVDLDPEDAEALANLANLYRVRGRFGDGADLCLRAIAIDPDLASAYINLANCARMARRLDEALWASERAVALAPGLHVAHDNRGHALLWSGHVEPAIAALREGCRVAPDVAEPAQTLLFTLLYSDQVTAEEIAAETRRFGERFRPVPSVVPDRPLKTIGFVSGDFREHPVGRFLLPLVQRLTGGRFRLVAFQNSALSDELTERLKGSFDRWVNIKKLDTDEARAAIEAEEVDLLIDLSGHTGENRLDVFGKRAAPVQATWLGYSGSTGVPAMDWILVDPVIARREDQAHYSERIAYLPHFACFDTDGLPQPAPPPSLANGYVTFGCFNFNAKISPSTLEAWARLLQSIPDARLFLKDQNYEAVRVRDRILEGLGAHGVDPGRVTFSCLLPRDQHYAAFGHVDIALDPFPYGGATTTAEALAMGVPVVTLYGDRYVGRMSASLVQAVGHSDWIAATPAEYVETAARLATDRRGLMTIRRELRDRLTESPAGNPETFSEAFAGLAEDLWEKSKKTRPFYEEARCA